MNYMEYFLDNIINICLDLLTAYRKRNRNKIISHGRRSSLRNNRTDYSSEYQSDTGYPGNRRLPDPQITRSSPPNQQILPIRKYSREDSETAFQDIFLSSPPHFTRPNTPKKSITNSEAGSSTNHSSSQSNGSQ